MFVSRTDKRGVIQNGNEVFVRVSGYEKSQLIGCPHNIIRHPDMPKAVFKLFWDYLKSNKVVAAYVKNRSLEGEYYWVLAVAMPTSSGYFSVRSKPNSDLFPVVEKIYRECLKIERSQNVEASEKHLFHSLNVLDFRIMNN